MSTRERIVDAAAEVMRDKGIAAATTREIARAAQCSEALLYKHFGSKQELFVAVLSERLPRLEDPQSLVGARTVTENLQTLVAQLFDFYLEGFPIAVSIFGSRILREEHRDSMRALGAGPALPTQAVERYLDAEIVLGRLPDSVDAHALSRILTGAAFFEAFLATYEGESGPDTAETAHRVVAQALRGVDAR